MKALTRKLLRDITQMWGAVLTISLVVAFGVAAFVTLHGTYLSIVQTRDRYYGAERFADVFLQLERAPDWLIPDIEAIDGVARVHTRVVGHARVPVASLSEPAQAQVISIPAERPPPLNGLRLVSGRLPSADRDDEAALLEVFAEKHGIKPGDRLEVVIEGRKRRLRIVGTAMSPEFVLAVPGGGIAPAPERFAVLWMPAPAAEAAYDMRSAFNNVVLRLSPSAQVDAVKQKLDALFDAYGGLGAYGRDRQTSNSFLSQELVQLEVMATIAPLIFLGVAAFLLNIVLSRLIELDRPQIATLKAVGYSNREVGLHYFELTLLITFLGAIAGLGLGAFMGRGMTDMYVAFYRFPNIAFRLDPSLVAKAVLVSLAAALAGSFLSVRRVVLLPPAEAMRPAAPPSYRQGVLGGALSSWLGPSARMVLREVMRRPVRTLLSAVGIAAATGILVLAQFFSDAIGFLIDFYIQAAQRETLAVEFLSPVPEASVRALRSYPGVRDVQWQAAMSVRVRAGHQSRIVPLVGHPARHSLRPLLDDDAREVSLGAQDVLFTDMLAKLLEVEPGDTVTVEPVTGERTPREITMTGTIDELMGLWIHMPSARMHALFRQAPYATTALLVVDGDQVEETQARIVDMPQVASVMRKDVLIREFRKQTGETMGTFSFVLGVFAMGIAVSVVYNNARVALSLRSRELASLRVLGFTRREISSILIGELFVQVFLGVPLGLGFGKLLAMSMLAANDPEAFRFPSNLSAHTLAFAAAVTFGAALLSALAVRRKLDKLDLIGVLKTRE